MPRLLLGCVPIHLTMLLLVVPAHGARAVVPSDRRAVPALAAIHQSDTIVKRVGAPIHRRVATLVPELTTGVVDGPPEYTFFGVADLLLCRDGSIFVLEVPPGGAPSLRQYEANRTFVRAGRDGSIRPLVAAGQARW